MATPSDLNEKLVQDATHDHLNAGQEPSSSKGSSSGSISASTTLQRRHNGTGRVQNDVGEVLARHSSVGDAASLASIDRPPSEEEKLPPSKIYHPLSFPVIALLMPASIFGVLARLGLQAITTYDGRSIFPLAWIQAAGCLIMGFALGMKEPFGRLCVLLCIVFSC